MPISCTRLAFHPDGRRILSGSLDGTVKVWDAVTSRSIVFRGHSGVVLSVEFRADGHLVSTAWKGFGATTEMKVWNIEQGQEDQITLAPDRDGSRVTVPPETGSEQRRLSPDGSLLAETKWIKTSRCETRKRQSSPSR